MRVVCSVSLLLAWFTPRKEQPCWHGGWCANYSTFRVSYLLTNWIFCFPMNCLSCWRTFLYCDVQHSFMLVGAFVFQAW
jgi:hypothetical protein